MRPVEKTIRKGPTSYSIRYSVKSPLVYLGNEISHWIYQTATFATIERARTERAILRNYEKAGKVRNIGAIVPCYEVEK